MRTGPTKTQAPQKEAQNFAAIFDRLVARMEFLFYFSYQRDEFSYLNDREALMHILDTLCKK